MSPALPAKKLSQARLASAAGLLHRLALPSVALPTLLGFDQPGHLCWHIRTTGLMWHTTVTLDPGLLILHHQLVLVRVHLYRLVTQLRT